ncbi:hypothetical protein HY993_02855 [Candidatus Micrarchaeota archaeon]|nr:hypothetical protein [Candidatus Micrarchaeota archaeon]
MMLVVDANILFSAVIRNAMTRYLFSYGGLALFAPDFIFEEFEEHKPEILLKTQKTESEFNAIFNLLKEKISIFSENDLKEYYKQAKRISPDEFDVAYFATALKTNSPIWSNDSAMKEKQSSIRVYSTKDLIELLGEPSQPME